MMEAHDVWLVVNAVSVFVSSLAIVYVVSTKRRIAGVDARHLEDEVVRMRIKLDMLADGTERAPRTQRSGNVTVDVLKVVTEEPKTAREIQAVLGQSREHVARLVKKMSEDGYLERRDTRPFRYSITKKGSKFLSSS